MASVFLSYRRADTGDFVGRLSSRLQRALGPENVFVDVDAIAPGQDFVEVIRQAVADATVLVAVIGPRWLTLSGPDGEPGLWQPGDAVRLEVESALSRGTTVIPVLVNDASMPGPDELPMSMAGLSRRNALRIGQDTFSSDVERLIDAIRRSEDPGASTVPRARLTEIGEELRAIAIDFFTTAGRRADDTLDRRLLGPEPILIADSSSLTEGDIEAIKAAVQGRDRLYLIHPDQLFDDSVHELDRLRAHGSAIVTLSGNTMAAAITDNRVRMVLHELEREYGSGRNLFQARNAVIDERFLFGRSELLTRLGGAIAAGESVLLTGLRKAGKTSVLNILRQNLVDYPVCHIDLQRFDRADERWPSQLFAVLLEAYDRWGRAQWAGWDFHPSGNSDAFTELDRRRVYQDSQGRPTPFVLLLDEMERVLPFPGETAAATHYARASGLIRALAQTYPGWLVVIAADLRPTANRMNLLPNGETNPLFQFFEETPIRLLGQDAVGEMIRSLCRAMGVWDVDEQLGREVFQLSGGHPALVRMLAGASYGHRKHTQQLQTTDLSRGLDELAERNQPGSFFEENFWIPMTKTEQQVIVEASALSPDAEAFRLPPAEIGAVAEARAALAGQGLLRDGRVAVGAFAAWVRALS